MALWFLLSVLIIVLSCAVSTRVFGFFVYLRLGVLHFFVYLFIISLNPLFSLTKAKEHKKFSYLGAFWYGHRDWNTKKGKGSALVGVLGFLSFFLLIFISAISFTTYFYFINSHSNNL